jgi:hypothetical protein
VVKSASDLLGRRVRRQGPLARLTCPVLGLKPPSVSCQTPLYFLDIADESTGNPDER